jgi:bacterioferritin-associated ferredoxin
MLQLVLVISLFLAAVFYVGRMIYRNFTSKTGCESGCGKCAVDFGKVEQQIQKKQITPKL